MVDIRKDYDHPSHFLNPDASLHVIDPAAWKTSVIVVVLVKGQAYLFHIVDALSVRRAGAHLLHRRDEQSDQDANDGADD